MRASSRTSAVACVARSNVENAPRDLAGLRMLFLRPGMQGRLHGVGGEYAHHLQGDISRRDELSGKEFELRAGLTQRGLGNEGGGGYSAIIRAPWFRREHCHVFG